MQVTSIKLIVDSTWCIQGDRTSSSSEYADERAPRPAPGTNAYFNEKIYCTCKRC